MARSEDFTQTVAEKLSELTAEQPTVSEQQLADALLKDSGASTIDSETLREALDELQVVSVAVLLGENAEQGRMWRHSGMTDADARRLLAEQAELERRDAAAAEDFEAAALARAEEIEGGGEPEDTGDDPAVAAMRRRDRTSPAPHANSGETQRVELPMAVAGSLDEDSIGKIVTAGLRAADEAGAGFEFIVTR